MNYCFNKQQIEKSFEYLFNNSKDEDIGIIIENSKFWDDKIIIMNYIVTQIIQKKIKNNKLPKEFVNKLYSMREIGNIVIDEIDDDFIEFLFRHNSISTKINDNLLYFKLKHLEHDYRDQICY